MVAPTIVLVLSNFVYRQSNEEQNVQNQFICKIQQFRGPLIQTPLRLRLEKKLHAVGGPTWAIVVHKFQEIEACVSALN